MLINNFKSLFLIFFLVTFSAVSSAGNTTPDSLLVKYHLGKNDSVKLQALREIVNYWKTGDSDSIVFYSKILIREAVKCGEFRKAYKGYYWVINVYSNKSKYDSALIYAFSGLEYYLKYGMSYPATVLLALIGEQYRAMAQPDDAIMYLKEAWFIADTGKQFTIKTPISNRLASVYYEKGLLDSTLIWVDSSINISRMNSQHDYDIKNLMLRGAVLRDKTNFNEALKCFNEARLILKKTPDNSEISNVLNNISSTYSLMGDWENVIKFAEKSYLISSTNKLKALTMVSSDLLANAYNKIGDFKKAYKFGRIYEQTHNDIFFEDRDQLISELNTKYNLKQKENKIEIQKINIAKKNLKIRQNNFITLYFIIIFIILILFLIFRYRVYKRLKKINSQLTEKNALVNKQKTEIENYSHKLNDAYNKLQKLDEFKQAATSMLVHDLKNPLNLLVNIDTIKNESEKKSILARTSKQMLRLVLNLLDINKAENNTMKLDKAEVNLIDIIRHSYQEINYLSAQKNIRLFNKSKYNVNIIADCEILSRVFINLFTNAIKFSPINSEITIDTEITENNFLKVSVIDSGPGISKEHHNTIFEKYTQIGNSQTPNMGSTGIGLAYCKLAIETHGWTIGVDSESGKGADFWILINDYSVIDVGKLPDVDNDSYVEEDKITISEINKQLLEPYLNQLLKVGVYAISDVKRIILEIKKNKIMDIDPWIQQLQFATTTLNEEKFVLLIKSLIDDDL